MPTPLAPPPDREVRPWDTEGEQKREAVQKMFSLIAGRYDFMNRVMSLNLDRAWRRKVVEILALKPGDTALDLCSGTGDFLPLLRRRVGPAGKLFAADFCLPMLEQTRRKDPALQLLTDACAIPIPTNTVQGVSVGWGIRNVPDIDLAHREIFRVLKPGGKFVSIDMAVPRSPLIRKISAVVFGRIIPRIGGWLSDPEAYRYLPESTSRFMNREQLAESMRAAGFESVQFHDLFLGNICIHQGTKPCTL